MEQNEREVHQLIYLQHASPDPRSGADVQHLLFQIADFTNRNIAPAGRFQTWHIDAHQSSLAGGPAVSGPEAKIPPNQIEGALVDFCNTVWLRFEELERDPVPLAAWAEWQLNGGSLHPFYDGCGRISRAFAASSLVRANYPLPLFDDSASYFAHGNRGLMLFADYYRERIRACH